MTVTSSNLNFHVTWDQVAQVLELPGADHQLPTLTSCPLCRGKMRIYEDTKFRGHYHYCFDCHSEGDMIRLLEKCWEISPQEALDIVSSAGYLSEDLKSETIRQRYLKRCRGTFEQAAELWKIAQADILNPDNFELETLQSVLNLGFDKKNADRWAAGPGKILGGTHTTKINLMLFPSSKERGGRYRGATRKFRGETWGNTLVIPLYSFPSRIQAFVFVGRRGRIMQDVAFQPVYRHEGRFHRKDAGMVCGNLMSQVKADKIIVTEDWLLTLQLQMRNFRTSMLPLPLAAWWDHNRLQTDKSWIPLDGRPGVIWATKVTNSVIERAVDGNMPISTCQPKSGFFTENGRRWLRRFEGQQLTDYVVSQARPWPAVVQAWYKKYPELLAESIENWEQRELPVSDILRATKLKKAGDGKYQRRVRMTQKKWLEERKGRGWLYGETAQMREITNAIVRINRVVYDEKLDESFYRGSIRIKSNRAHFLVPHGLVTDAKKFFDFLTRLCQANQLGVLRFLPQYRHKMLAFATALHPPKQVKRAVQDELKSLRESGYPYQIF